MTDKNAKDREAVRKFANGVRIAFFLSVIIDVSDVYRFINVSGEIRQGIGIALGILGTILLWLVSRDLKAEKKQALYFWLAMGLLSQFRWIVIDAAFDLNVISLLVLLLIIAVTLRMMLWTRNGVLT